MKNGFKALTFLLGILAYSTVFALVEYGDDSNSGVSVRLKDKFENNAPAKTKSLPQSVKKFSRGGNNGAQLTEKMFDLGMAYESLAVKEKNVNGSVGLYRFFGSFQTPINIFMDISYYAGKTASKEISKEEKLQKGNPKFILGFNWLKIGAFEERAQVDVYGGFSARENKSTLASSRDDKIVGLRTTKNFYSVVIGLIGELTLTGTPKNAEELDIGNISKLGGALGWVVSSDIRLEAEMYRYLIQASNIEDRANRLHENVSFTVVSPRVLLKLVQGIELSLGGHFRPSKKQNNESLINARLYDVEGVYGNSAYLGLNLSL